MTGEKPTPEEVKNIASTEDRNVEKSDEIGVDQQEPHDEPEREDGEKSEAEEMNESVDKVLAWIEQGADIQKRILDLTKQSFDGDLSGDEAANIIRQFESIPGDIAKVAAEFDTAIVALMEQKRGADSDLTLALRNAARLRGELEERMAGIEQRIEKDDFERLTTMLKESSEKSGERFMDWSEQLLKEIKSTCDEVEKMKQDGEDSDAIEELQQEIDERKGNVSRTFRRFIADARLHFLRFRTNNYRLSSVHMASSMKGERKALEFLKFKKQDEQLMRFADEFIERMSAYEHELNGRLEALGEQKQKE